MALILLLALGLWTRWLTLPLQQHFWTLDALLYFEPQARALRDGDLLAFLFSWQGLHPPLSGWLHGAGLALGISLGSQLRLTLAASLLAALIVGWMAWRHAGSSSGLLLFGLLVVAPLQANYALYPLAYPWLLLLIAASTAALAHALQREDGAALQFAGVLALLAALTHVLALACLAAQALVLLVHVRGRWRRWDGGVQRWLLLAGAGVTLTLGSALVMSRAPGDVQIVGFDLGLAWQLFQVLGDRFTHRTPAWELLLCALGCVLGLRGAARSVTLLVSLQALAYLAALTLFLALGVADPRQTHYLPVPQLLLISGAVIGFSAFLRPLAPRRKTLCSLILALACAPWASSVVRYDLDLLRLGAEARASQEARLSASAFAETGADDVLIYLWQMAFVNDEPEHIDPGALGWELGRLGPLCLDFEPTRFICSDGGRGRFVFLPSAISGDFAPYEERLRLAINAATPDGVARILIAPRVGAHAGGQELIAWIVAQGGSLIGQAAGRLLYELPAGTRIKEPR